MILEIPLPLKKVKDNLLFYWFYSVSPLKTVFKENEEKLLHYQNIHRGEKCFIIGAGPSLKNTNLSLLKNKYVIGVNSVYRHGKSREVCDYFACSDQRVWKVHREGILDLDLPTFLASDAARDYAKENIRKQNVTLVRTKSYLNVLGYMPTNLAEYISGGHTVIADICLPLTLWMGFDTVYLVGCDYENKGVRWDGLKTENLKAMGLRKEDRVMLSFEKCKHAFEYNGKKIINATIGGKLEVFERTSLESVLE